MDSNTKQIIKNLKVEDVIDVYSGKEHKCCCGCSGKYSYASAHRALGAKLRGYGVDDSDVNDKQVRKVFGLMIAQLYADAEIEVYGNSVDFVLGQRLYMLHFKRSDVTAVAA